jgi:hypothetical protein
LPIIDVGTGEFAQGNLVDPRGYSVASGFPLLREPKQILLPFCFSKGDCRIAALLTRNPVRFSVTFIVMARLVPAIGRGTLPLQMAEISPAMTVRAGFIQGGSATAGVKSQ